ncbi:MAG: hypothetical protein GKR90_22660 [Pseudomonadales bacterium]|nr:hypothetical protein [Pseudomonadales bacterium]
MHTRLFHFSDVDSIKSFVPRPVLVPTQRSEGQESLNSPLVWAIDEWHQPMYLFPRDCPRILLWRKDETTKKDLDLYFGSSDARILAYVEESWRAKIESETIYRYELPSESFQSLEDAGMWVSQTVVDPTETVALTDLPSRLRRESVELRVLDVLTSLKGVWNTTLHASGIRLRNATKWGA